MSAFFNFLFAQVPREVRRSWRAILLAAILFYGPAVTTYLALREHPERTTSFVSPAMISRAEDGAERARKGTGYIEDPKDARPVMGSFVMTNNIKVALLAFAAGVTLVGTPLILLFNAVSIGAVLALYANKGVFPLIEAFIIPHSVLELTAIVIAGAAGLLLAGAILTPGRQTRKDALVAAAKRSLRLVSCSTLFLVFAGMLEGFVSPNPHIAVSWKIAAAALSAIGAIAFVSLGTGATEAPAP